MSGSCPVSAHVCRETARERDELRRWKAEALPVLDGLQELGKALRLPLGSRITGTVALAAVERLTRERDDLAAEVVNLHNHVRALTEDVARSDTLATILDGAREGLARSGSRAKGVRDVQALLTASAVREGVEGARRRVLSTRRREDRGRAASNALSLLRERDAARAEVERLRGERHNLTAEVVRLRTALDDLVDGWEDIGRGDLHPLIRGAALSAAGQVRDVLWPEEDQ